MGRACGPFFAVKPRFPGEVTSEAASALSSAGQHSEDQPAHMHWLLWSANLRLIQRAQASALRKKTDCDDRFAEASLGLRDGAGG